MTSRRAGVNIPVFSLRTKKSMGSGEFLDLILLIDWAKQAGFKLIQLLPINDTSITETKEDGYPYSILSVFSLHPLYLHVQALGEEFAEEMTHIQRELNHPKLDYQKTYFAKRQLLKKLFHIRGEKDLSSKDFAKFFAKSKEHLQPYAAFCILRDRYGTSDFRSWKKHSIYSEVDVEKICENARVEFYYFLQYHLDKQLREVCSYARKQGILLKGDFPMGVHPNSVEAWRFFEYFRFDQSMGAPPDFYNPLGQNWGFPSYNWEEIRKEGFYWLKSRLAWMEQYFDVIRIDHVLGYFRLWEIPEDEVRGLMGNFYPAKGYAAEELPDVYSNKLKSWEFDKEVPSIFRLRRASVFIDTKREVDGKSMEKPMQSKTNSSVCLSIKRLCEPYGEKLPKGLETQRQVEKKIEDRKKRDKLYEQIENVCFFKREGSYHPRVDLKNTRSFKALDPTMQKKVLTMHDEYYLTRQDALWNKEGREKLVFMQKHTSMLICAEDIGVIPHCSEVVLKEVKMLNLYVQRMPKSFELEYEDPKDFPSTCVCTPSNHDTGPIREWWETDPDSTKRYYHMILRHSGDPPSELTEELAQEIIQAHLDSKAKWAIFLLQDLFAMSEAIQIPDPKEERINNPAFFEDQWQWRMHLYIEELLLAKSFTQMIHDKIKKGKR